jgi:hypothetical protein
MQDFEGLTPVEREVESALARLHPQDAAVSRENVLYLAGRAAGYAQALRQARTWQAAAAVLALTTGLSLAWHGLAPTPAPPNWVAAAHPQPRVKTIPTAAVSAPAPAPDVILANNPGPFARIWLFRPPPGSYLDLRDRVLARGLDALPKPPASKPQRQPTLQDLLATPM